MPMKMRRLTIKVKFKCTAHSQRSRKVKFTLTLPFEVDLAGQPTHFHRHFGAHVLYYLCFPTFAQNWPKMVKNDQKLTNFYQK